ncbi:MAG: enoyl-CoA hydratase/isomerase family protein [Planctomycetes bacterium]|nr:enoyl-CoA hydratase/isomerase family protein [Planctomycetota bacterium]
MSHLRYHCDGQHYAWVEFDNPDARVNVLGSMMMQELNDILDSIVTDKAQAVIFCSAKEGQFIAGADINELAAIQSQSEAAEKSNLGQKIFQRIADLSCPTIALINGPCMGGGTELSLACDWRIITDHAKVSMALPEVRLGIIPGWGGCIRLSKIVGFMEAVSLICSGRTLHGRKCLRAGIAQHQVNDAFAREQCVEFMISKVINKKPKIKRRGIIAWLMNHTAFGRRFVINKAHKSVISQGGGHYPAPLEVLDLLADTWNESSTEAYAQESKLFAKLSQTKVSSALVQLFLQNEAAKKRYGDIETAPINHAGVIGAGVMGGGIAWLLSEKGINVRLKDLQWDALTQAFHTAAEIYKSLVKKRRMTEQEVNVAMNRMSGGLNDIALRHADIIIEAVVENVEVKRNVLAECEKHVADTTTICSNTSSLCLSAMHDVLQNPQRFVGMHFFNPVNRMPLVEVIAGPHSDELHLARVVQAAVKMGKTPVVVQDCAGFLVNRILTPYMNEAVWLLHDGVSIERVDQIFKDFGMPMGPFALADEVGIDVGYKVAHNLCEAYGERMTVAPMLQHLALEMKLLGKKSGKGFYIHGKGKKHPLLNKKVEKYQHKVAVDKTQNESDIRDRCLLLMVNEACRCLDEGIVATAAELDLAMIMGTGFPPFRGGLLQYADARGLERIAARLRELAKIHGSRFEPVANMAERHAFYNADGEQENTAVDNQNVASDKKGPVIENE